MTREAVPLYRVSEKIGIRRMGVVYRAEDTRLYALVATI